MRTKRHGALWRRTIWIFLTALLTLAVPTWTPPAQAASQTEAQALRHKKEVFYRLRAGYENLLLEGDYTEWSGLYGNDPRKWPVRLQQELARRWEQLQQRDYVSSGFAKALTDGELDNIVTQASLELVNYKIVVKAAKALVQLGGLFGLFGAGLDDMIIQIVQTVMVEVLDDPPVVDKDNVVDLLKDHGDKVQKHFDDLGAREKVAFIRDIKDKIANEITIEMQEAAVTKGAQGQSTSGDSVAFDAPTGMLTFDGDLIVGIENADYSDPEILNAEVDLPAFTFAGLTNWGTPRPVFHTVDDHGEVSIGHGSTDLFLGDLSTLLYFDESNAFLGLIPLVIQNEPGSLFVDELERTWDDSLSTGLPSLLLIEIEPRADIGLATSDFTQSTDPGGIAFDNVIGFREVPEPPGWTLSTLPLAILLIVARRRWHRRPGRSG